MKKLILILFSALLLLTGCSLGSNVSNNEASPTADNSLSEETAAATEASKYNGYSKTSLPTISAIQNGTYYIEYYDRIAENPEKQLYHITCTLEESGSVDNKYRVRPTYLLEPVEDGESVVVQGNILESTNSEMMKILLSASLESALAIYDFYVARA